MSEQQQTLKCTQCDHNLIILDREKKRHMALFIGCLDEARAVAIERRLPQHCLDALDEALTKIRATPEYKAYFDAVAK